MGLQGYSIVFYTMAVVPSRQQGRKQIAVSSSNYFTCAAILNTEMGTDAVC